VLSREAAKRGFRLTVESFPAHGFAARFSEAVATSAAPDVIVFDNFGVIDGITTPLGTFEGIGRDPTIRTKLVRVTGALDELLPPQRGWDLPFFLIAELQRGEGARHVGAHVHEWLVGIAA
jgi:hypothetical protein